jgi:hypothetical protein
MVKRRNKTSKKRLDAYPKNHRPLPHARASIAWQDAALKHCWHLGTLVEVLTACGEPLEPQVVKGIGCLIGREVAALKELTNQLAEAR